MSAAAKVRMEERKRKRNGDRKGGLTRERFVPGLNNSGIVVQSTQHQTGILETVYKDSKYIV